MTVEEVSRAVSEEERVTVNQSRDKVVSSPDFDPDEVPDLDLQRTVRSLWSSYPRGEQYYEEY